MDENIPNLSKEINIPVQETQLILSRIKRPIVNHIIIKLLKVKDKERIVKAVKEKPCYIQGSLYKIISRFLSVNLAGQRQWVDIFIVLKEKYQARMLSSKTVLQI